MPGRRTVHGRVPIVEPGNPDHPSCIVEERKHASSVDGVRMVGGVLVAIVDERAARLEYDLVVRDV